MTEQNTAVTHMDTDVKVSVHDWKAIAEELKERLGVLERQDAAKADVAKALCDASIAMAQKDQEIWNHKDFRSVFALADAQGFRYNGPMITETGKALVAAIQEFQKVWK